MKHNKREFMGVLCNEDMLGDTWSKNAIIDVHKTIYLFKEDPRWFYIHVVLIGSFAKHDIARLMKVVESDECREILVVDGELYVDVDHALKMSKDQMTVDNLEAMEYYCRHHMLTILAKVLSDVTSDGFISAMIRNAKAGENAMVYKTDNGEHTVEVVHEDVRPPDAAN